MKKLFTGFNLLVCSFLLAQNNNDFGQISGNFQSDFQYYIEDTLIDPSGEANPDERVLRTGFLNLTYTKGNFIAGIRYENYQNQRVGLPAGYNSEGITYRYARFIKDGFDVTAGNYYEQFGSGLVLRTYEERGLGIDNNLDGLRLVYQPAAGINLKGIIGRQRNYFEKGDGLVRGFDAEWSLKPTLGWTGNTNLIIGGSFVSKYEAANDPELNLPENVGSGAIRVNLITGNFNIYGEYARKSTDPNAYNGYIFKEGEGLYATASYANNGLGVSLGFKRYDNFFFKSQRESDLQQLFINYLPSLTTLHTYTLPALYSFNTQGNGEMGFQGEISYNFKRNTLFGGKYGTLLTLSYANSYSLDKDYKLRPAIHPRILLSLIVYCAVRKGIPALSWAVDLIPTSRISTWRSKRNSPRTGVLQPPITTLCTISAPLSRVHQITTMMRPVASPIYLRLMPVCWSYSTRSSPAIRCAPRYKVCSPRETVGTGLYCYWNTL